MRLFLFFFLSVFLTGNAQVIPDSLALKKGKEQARYIYERAMEGIHHLYNGSEYIAYQPMSEEHPYFASDEWTLGQLKYDDEWFYGVPLLFDIDKQALIASYYYKGIKMQLVHNRVNEFVIQGHHFINTMNLSDSASLGNTFCELMYDGNIKVLVRRTKKISKSIEGLEEIRSFIESAQIYLLINSHLFKIASKHDVLTVLGKNRKELKSFIRKNGLFINNRESSTVQVARYFDSLNP